MAKEKKAPGPLAQAEAQEIKALQLYKNQIQSGGQLDAEIAQLSQALRTAKDELNIVRGSLKGYEDLFGFDRKETFELMTKEATDKAQNIINKKK